MIKKSSYKAVPKNPGIFHNVKSGRYQARKSVQGKQFKETFDTIYDARLWHATFDGQKSAVKKLTTSTLQDVWTEMQRTHFTVLAKSTRDIWLRRFELLTDFLPYRMEEITSSVITTWVEKQVGFFKSEEYTNNSRGEAKRCNLDNELNLFTTIFNWYKTSETFEAEAISLLNPVRLNHKRMGFIKAKPVKNKSITLDAALQFFNCVKPLYRDLALLQYYTASRIGEVAGAQWPRIDFENRQMIIMETCRWDGQTKMFVELNPFPKNKEPRIVYITDEIMEILQRRLSYKVEGNDFVFHVQGAPLNYSTIQMNYRDAQRKANIPFRGTHILRHGMAKLARKVGGGLDAVVAMTGHKDYKLANHYSKLDSEYQKEISEKIMDHMNDHINAAAESVDSSNVLRIANFSKAK